MNLFQDLRLYAQFFLKIFGVRISRHRAMRDPVELLVLKAKELGVGTVLDVGANTGQFVIELRKQGWRNTVVSFEPLSAAHRVLTSNAMSDKDWIVPPATALGNSSGEANINISKNLVSSSLLPIDIRSTDVQPMSGYSGTETINIARLDDMVLPEWKRPFALKLDTQGFEMEVLQGSQRTLPDIAVIVAEVSLVSLYNGGARLSQIFEFLEARGFKAISITEGFSDIKKNEVLQVDVTFIKNI